MLLVEKGKARIAVAVSEGANRYTVTTRTLDGVVTTAEVGNNHLHAAHKFVCRRFNEIGAIPCEVAVYSEAGEVVEYVVYHQSNEILLCRMSDTFGQEV